MVEIWKPIKGAEGRYEISNFGRVKSFCGREPRILKQRNHRQKRKCGDIFYKSVVLDYEVMKQSHKLVHRLVAEAFVPNPNGYPIVNHKDENPLNNRSDNLEWCTYSYNAKYGNAQERRMESVRKERLI